MQDKKNSHFRKPLICRAGRISRLTLLFVIFFHLVAVSQNISKTGGVCFRVDDNPSLVPLNQFDSIFQKYQQKFCLAITSWALPASPAYVAKLKDYINYGHELLDNTPTHQTHYFKLLNIQDTSLYENSWGVDHFWGDQVCLKYTAIDTTVGHNEGPVNIFGNLVISAYNGEFADLNGNPYYLGLYFTYNNKLCLWYDLKNVDPSNPDTLKLKSFWGEPVDMGTHWWTSYHKMAQRDIYMHPSAIQLLGIRSMKIFDDLDITRPVTWIHPAGQMPWINAYNVKSNLGDSLGYTSGSNFVNSAYFCYNEYNNYDIKQFSLQSGDISIENHDFQWNKTQIANSFAKHFVKVDVSYFTLVQSDWTAYLKRVDSLLAWCIASNIPVKTYREWSSLLYDSLPARFINMFPKLNADLDGNNFPDGYDQDPAFGGIFQTSGGVAESGGRCFKIGGAGNISQITSLGGLEKGSNMFSIWVRRTGIDSSKVIVDFIFPETGTRQTVEFPVDTTIWVKKDTVITVPESASLVNILIKNEGQNQDTVMISGMDMRSAGFLKLTKYPEQSIYANEPFTSVDLNTLVAESIYPPSVINWTIQSHDTLNLTILPGKILQVMKPVSFWTGRDSTYLIAHSPDGLKDSCFMNFVSKPLASGCSGIPVMISLLDTLRNGVYDIIQWKSDPFDSTMSDTTVYNPIVAPDTTTTYTVMCINTVSGNINRDTITLERHPFPKPGLPADTAMCKGDSIRLTAKDGFQYLWNTGDTLASIMVKDTITTQYSVIVTSSYKCSTIDSILVTVSEKPTAQLNGLLDSYCPNDWAATLYGLPQGGTMSSTSSGFIADTIQSDHAIFSPKLADTGINVVWYTVTQNGCADTDTVKVWVHSVPNPDLPPDTAICKGDSIRLTAKEGLHFLWDTGNPADTLASILLTPAATRDYTVRATNAFGCSATDTTHITVSDRALVGGLAPAYCMNDWPASLYGLPPGGTMSSTSSGFKGDPLLPDKGQFYPAQADPGVNLVWYTVPFPFGCGDTDTVKVSVYAVPEILPLPDTMLCGGRTITLDAGVGFDNYLWTNGSIDQRTTVDSAGYGLGLYEIWVYVTKDGCVAKENARITFVVCPGLQDKELINEFALYPNPASDEIIIKVKSNIPELLHMQIMDLNGLIVKQMILENISNNIPVADLPRGTYILRIFKGAKKADYKFIKI